jgi:hypothetical protein
MPRLSRIAKREINPTPEEVSGGFRLTSGACGAAFALDFFPRSG